MINTKDISTAWKGSTRSDRRIIEKILPHEATPMAIIKFNNLHNKIEDDYWYWFVLSTLWVSYAGWSNLEMWKKLFKNKRENKQISIMKPSELEYYNNMPDIVEAFRCHRENEIDWISYTLKEEIAKKFSLNRPKSIIKKYSICKKDVLAIFLRRGEFEILVLDKNKANFIEIINQEEANIDEFVDKVVREFSL